jgi:hypothetical protein
MSVFVTSKEPIDPSQVTLFRIYGQASLPNRHDKAGVYPRKGVPRDIFGPVDLQEMAEKLSQGINFLPIFPGREFRVVAQAGQPANQGIWPLFTRKTALTRMALT